MLHIGVEKQKPHGAEVLALVRFRQGAVTRGKCPRFGVANSQHHRALVIALCVAAYAIVAISVFWLASPWNDSRLPSSPIGATGVSGYDYGDAAQMTWFLARVPYALRNGLSIFHTGLLDYPPGVDLAHYTNAPL